MTAPQSPLIAARNQEAEAGDLVALFALDLAALGGPTLHFTSTQNDGNAINFGGIVYTPIDFEAQGFDYSGTGGLPTPSLRIGNAEKIVSALIAQYGDLVGALATRIRTYRRYLDGEAEADPTAFFPPDVFVINRKAIQNKVFVEWELAAAFDAEGTQLPRRQVLREICTHRYRRFEEATLQFDYTDATCPYAGDPSFDEVGTITSDPQDRCGKRIFDCRLRFGQNGVLPARFFPGAGVVR